MKILLLTDSMQIGGVESHVADLARCLHRNGDRVAILSGGGALSEALESEGIPQYRLPLPTHNPYCLLVLRHRILRLVQREGFELLHAHTRLTAFLLRGLQRHDVPVVVSVHARFRTSPLLSRLCNWGAHSFAVSRDLKRYVCTAYHLPPGQVSIIPNGVDCTAFARITRPLASDTEILFASRLDRDCSLTAELLCEIAPTLHKTFPALHITLAGGGSEYPRLATRAAEINRQCSSELITCVGEVRDMPRLMQHAGIFVGVSRAAIEASCTGAAVLLSGNEGYFGILTAENAPCAAESNFCGRGCALPKAERLLADLIRFLQAPQESHRIAAALSDYMRTHHSAEAMAAALRGHYEELCRQRPPRRLTLAGYFGCGNLGDDAILGGLLQGLQETAPQLSLTLLSGSPRRDRRRYGVIAHHRRNPFAILSALHNSDALLFVGGSLLQNITGNRSLVYYLLLIKAARQLGRPVFFCGAGIGPLIGKKACLRVKVALNTAASVGLRDGDSLLFLRRLGVRPELLCKSGDPALLLPTPKSAFQKLTARPTLCLVLNAAPTCRSLTPLLIAAARSFCHTHALTPLVLVLDRKQDAALSRHAADMLNSPCVTIGNPAEALACLSNASVVLTLRLHAMILASLCGIPSLGIAADPRDEKIPSFAKAVGAAALSPDAVSVPSLIHRLEEILTDAPATTRYLHSGVGEMQKNLRKDLANLCKMIYNEDNPQTM